MRKYFPPDLVAGNRKGVVPIGHLELRIRLKLRMTPAFQHDAMTPRSHLEF